MIFVIAIINFCNGQLMSREESRIWFREVLPMLARLLLRLPSLLELHYRDADNAGNGLRVMDQQESGIVFLSQVG